MIHSKKKTEKVEYVLRGTKTTLFERANIYCLEISIAREKLKMSVEHFHLSEIFGVFQLNYLVEDFRRYFFYLLLPRYCDNCKKRSPEKLKN